MKAVIIENEYDVPNELQAFIDENKDLFTEVDIQLFCKERPLQDIARFVIPANAVIVMSTFMYKDQLEEFVRAFASGALGTKKFYIYYFTRQLNEWLELSERYLFDDYDGFLLNVKKLVKEQDVYTINEDYNAPQDKLDITFNKYPRSPYRPFKIHYNEEENYFWDESEGDNRVQ